MEDGKIIIEKKRYSLLNPTDYWCHCFYFKHY